MRHLSALLLSTLLLACASHPDAGATPGTEGTASLTLVRATGPESLVLSGPPGELRIRFEDRATECILWLSADEPRPGDLTADAKARRVSLDVRVSTKEAPGLVTGAATTTTTHAGTFFKSDSTVVVTRHRSATLEDSWWSSGGGTVKIAPVGALGTDVTIELTDVVLAPYDDEGPATLSGQVTAKVQKLFVNGAGGACPANVPGR